MKKTAVHFFWLESTDSGFVMQDYNARQYVAYTLSTALSQNIAAEDVIAVSAMEAVGVSAAMTKYMAIPGNPKVPISTFLLLCHPTFQCVKSGLRWLLADTERDVVLWRRFCEQAYLCRSLTPLCGDRATMCTFLCPAMERVSGARTSLSLKWTS